MATNHGRTRPRLSLGVLAPAAMAVFLASGVSAQLADVGLSAVRSHRFGRESLPNANPDGDDGFALAFASGDFNGDGAADLATGAPSNDGPGATPVDRCGEVVVRYGQTRKGLANSLPVTVLGQFRAGSTDPAELNDQFGQALVACNLNGDAYDDLVVGVPNEGIVVSATAIAAAGVVEVYYGTSGGLVPQASARLRERPAPGEVDLPASFAYFGSALACGDFNADGFDDLAAGLPTRSLPNGSQGAGRVNVFPGSAAGVGASHKVLDQTILGDGDPGDPFEHFGSALAAGDFDGDGYADLAVGVPDETAAAYGHGGVHMVHGGASGLPNGSYLISQADADPYNEDGGGFGSTLAAGDFDADGYADLVAGMSDREVSGHADAGLALVLYGSSVVIDLKRTRSFSEDSLAPLTGAADELFGEAVAAGDFDGDGVDDLAIGAAGENGSAQLDVGLVAIVMGAAGVGLEPDPSRTWYFFPGRYGVPGDSSEEYIYLGSTLAAGDFDGDGVSDLAVGAPFENEGGLSYVGTATILYGARFADGFEGLGTAFWSSSAP